MELLKYLRTFHKNNSHSFMSLNLISEGNPIASRVSSINEWVYYLSEAI